MKKMCGLQLLPEDAVYNEMDSPVGMLTIVTSSAGVHAVLWDTDRENLECEKIMRGLAQSDNEKTIVQTRQQLAEYFQGKRTAFDLPLILKGTAFQLQAWKQLMKIPYGKTISYAVQAEKTGNRNRARPVGMANGMNPIPVIVPCHRVIGSNGQLTGFAGGVDKKAWLLKLEQGR